ncbi:processive diacylglycerol beta-glucosyltransferase [Paenibacillus baekrokdamisoli]|uniref:Processive diacylglycerol beta-glucosyltransferase n=1 Tax=Paenibacillus baekrokdamisoli TaxID=1712516 RepID=A0A3G9JA79_9BACL|nr:glycosyltransferase [Paenibacillus baekrokdamisoli]MBB3068206.1 processive 1,2-diacylglycerol beta-glucosyltransferase [Paenibacillus baekrokdamisoli]BBH22751.1 processive diacylglycerol beta-glucosyltransferase [Paenibacillus baekrokdamisoli]
MTRLKIQSNPKLLILYASYGDGHLQAARAIRDALADRGIENTVLIDLLAEAHPFINEMTRRVYMKSYSMLPGLYGWLYDRTRPMKHDSLFASWLHSFGRERLRKILIAQKPDAVIHTFPLLAMPALKQRTGLHIPSYTVVTDFDLHCRWVHPDIDRYYVPTPDMQQELISLGIQERRICISGIPLKRGFRSLSIDPSLRASYGLSAAKAVVLVMASAQGTLSVLSDILTTLLLESDVTLVVVCGRNDLLASTLRQLFSSAVDTGQLRVFGYIERMHELMALATCIVTKSGGVTLAEAMAVGLPIFTYRPVPGQERNNALYLEGKGAVTIVQTPEQLSFKIIELLRDPIRILSRKTSLQKLQRRNAADTIALDFCSSLHIMKGSVAIVQR